MDIINLIAVVIAIASLLASLAHVGYLAMLKNAATKRAGGGPIANYVSSRWPVAGGSAAGSVLALLFTAGGGVMDFLAILLAVGSGAVATKALKSTQERYRSGG